MDASSVLSPSPLLSESCSAALVAQAAPIHFAILVLHPNLLFTNALTFMKNNAMELPVITLWRLMFQEHRKGSFGLKSTCM
jgi:hypothetical protein